MNQEQRRKYLISYLLEEDSPFAGTPIPQDTHGQQQLLRSLMNVRQPGLPSAEFLEVQDAYLQQRIADRGVTQLRNLEPIEQGIYLWQGDITTLACDAIVNAANSGMIGCWAPCHLCIDNCIHTFAGVQLRYECAQLMQEQGYDEPTGQAKVTSAYNLPCSRVVHTVGPIVDGSVTQRDRELLASSYRACYEATKQVGATSLAYCCISTGVFRFPAQEAAEIALVTIQSCRAQDHNPLDVIFNVYLDTDLEIYQQLTG